MGLDKIGFDLMDQELENRKKQLQERYDRAKAEFIAQQARNLTSTGETRANDIKNIESNFSKANFDQMVTQPLMIEEQRIFQDWGGDRESASEIRDQYESEISDSKESEADFDARMEKRNVEQRDKGHNQDRGRD